jgi:3-phenylpropionate/trans-cinnamate dioxygenase ferredoxin reductase subunit
MLGHTATYDRLPYFYSDQYELNAQYVGHVPPGARHQTVLRGGSDPRQLVALWVADGLLLAGMVVGADDELPAITALIRSGRPVDISALRDPGRPITAGGDMR